MQKEAEICLPVVQADDFSIRQEDVTGLLGFKKTFLKQNKTKHGI